MLVVFKGKRYRFVPGVFLSLFFPGFAGLFILLGFWQLDRAEEKKQLASEFNVRQSRAPLLISQENLYSLNKEDMDYQSIKIMGRFETEYQFFLDNKKNHGTNGYHVITPFRIKNSSKLLLVNRGWINSGRNRQTLPVISTPENDVVLIGKLKKPATSHFRPGVDYPAENPGGIWLYLDTEYYSKLSNQMVFPYILQLSPENDFGFIREWPVFKANIEMHMGYALQWFVFALFTFIAYVSISFKNGNGNGNENEKGIVKEK